MKHPKSLTWVKIRGSEGCLGSGMGDVLGYEGYFGFSGFRDGCSLGVVRVFKESVIAGV